MEKNVTAAQTESEITKRNVLRYSNEEANRLTRECVETALIILMQEQNFASISITDIVKRAGVSRSAYYRNYSSKEDILSNVFRSSLDTILEAIRPYLSDMNEKGVYIQLFEKVKNEHKLFQIILGAKQENEFLHAVNQSLLDKIPETDLTAKYRMLSWIGSTVNIIFRWLEGGMKETPEEMALYCSDIFTHSNALII